MGQDCLFLLPEKDAMSGPQGITVTQNGDERCAGAVELIHSLLSRGQEGSCSSKYRREPLKFEEGKGIILCVF